MSDLDDLEEIADQCRYVGNNLTRNITKRMRESFQRSHERAVEASRTIEKQGERSTDRRHIVVKLSNQD